MTRRFLAVVLASASVVAAPALARTGTVAQNRVVAPGDSWVVDQTTKLTSLKIGSGATISAPAGKSLTLAVNGVERDLKPGSYSGTVVLTVTDQYTVKFSDTLTHHFRQAILLDSHGVVADQSVTAAAGNYSVSGSVLRGGDIRSDGEDFNGLLVTGGRWISKNLMVHFVGNGGNGLAPLKWRGICSA